VFCSRPSAGRRCEPCAAIGDKSPGELALFRGRRSGFEDQHLQAPNLGVAAFGEPVCLQNLIHSEIRYGFASPAPHSRSKSIGVEIEVKEN
jgi:hypothetical protein